MQRPPTVVPPLRPPRPRPLAWGRGARTAGRAAAWPAAARMAEEPSWSARGRTTWRWAAGASPAASRRAAPLASPGVEVEVEVRTAEAAAQRARAW